MRFRFYDAIVLAVLIGVAVSNGTMIALLAAIVGLLYFLVRAYITRSHATPTAPPAEEDEEVFVVSDSEKDGIVNNASIAMDVDIKFRSAPGHFRFHSQFDLETSTAEYEYKIDGTSALIRLLNSYDEGESTRMRDEWEIRDGVVLESDIRARWEAQKFKIGSTDEKIADLKKQTEWKVLAPSAFNGFAYYLLNRVLPVADARRFLRQEIERLKLANARATQEAAKYGLERDPNPESVRGWRWIGGERPEGVDSRRFWDAVEAGDYGISYDELGELGERQINQLHELLGDSAQCSKCQRKCLKTDSYCTGCGSRI
jgi:hypothetical protein